MDAVFALMSVEFLLLAAAIAVFAGLVKGLVGFAMPMIFLSGIGSFVAPELALAGLILPTLVTNVGQAFAQGTSAAWVDAKRFVPFLLVSGVCLVIAAQLVPYLETQTFFLVLGLPVFLFALSQLAGWELRLSAERPGRLQAGIGVVAGVLGGLSGVWGPPTVIMLTAFDTAKDVAMRVQGVVFGIGSVLLALSHIRSGVLDATGASFSALLVAPACLGMWVGMRMQGRINQVTFRRLTLVVLLVAGANLIRRGTLG